MSDNPNSIYEIAKASPHVTWDELEGVSEADVEAALGAKVPGGSSVYAWLPMVDGHTIHQTARDVMRSAIAAVDKARERRAEQPLERENPNSTLFEDPSFFPLEVLFGSQVYIWQQNRKGERSQITSSRKTIVKFAETIIKANRIVTGGATENPA